MNRPDGNWMSMAVRAVPTLAGAGLLAISGAVCFFAAAASGSEADGDWYAAAHSQILRGRLTDAAGTLEAAAGTAGGDIRMDLRRAELFHAAGLDREALRILRAARGNAAADDPAQPALEALLDRIGKTPLMEEPPAGRYRMNYAMETRLQTVRASFGDENVAALDALLEADPRGEFVFARADGVYASFWAAIDGMIRSAPPDARARWQIFQSRAADAAGLAGAPGDRDAGAPLRLFRRYPWASAAHREMLTWGERALREGHGNMARRAFTDVLARAREEDTRSRARVGAWLALAQIAEDRATLAADFADVPSERVFPWMDGDASAAEILERLSGSLLPPRKRPPAGRARPTILQTPPVTPWGHEFAEMLRADGVGATFRYPGDLNGAGGVLLYGAPNVLVCFDPDNPRPRWARAAPEPPSVNRRAASLDEIAPPGPFAPSTCGNRVYARWGIDSETGRTLAVAAFDAHTGETLWSTLNTPEWEGLLPVADPVYAEGRLYAPAMRRGFLDTFYVLCLDAADGAIIWQRQLTARIAPLPAGADERLGARRPRRIDFAGHGNPVTVDGGRVYLLGNAGFTAALDARDGLIEWIAEYPRRDAVRDIPRTIERRGSAPLLADDLVIVTPRDAPGVYAFRRDGGEPVWQAPFAPSDGLSGYRDGAVFCRDDFSLAALTATNGAIRWLTRLPERITGNPRLDDTTLYAGTVTALYLLDAAGGAVRERRPWPAGAPMPHFVIVNGVPRGTTPGVEGILPVTGEHDDRSYGGADRELRAPVRPALTLRRPEARIWPALAADRQGGEQAFYIYSAGLLERVTIAADGGIAIAWQRAVSPGFAGLEQAGDILLLTDGATATAVAPVAGATRWTLELPFAPDRIGLYPPRYMLAYREDRGILRAAALFDLNDGGALWRHDEPMQNHMRRLAQENGFVSLTHIDGDGHDLRWLAGRRRGGFAVLSMRTSDGSVSAVENLFGGAEGPAAAAPQHGAVFMLRPGDPPRLARYEARDGDGMTRLMAFAPVNAAAVSDMRIEWPWLLIREGRRNAPDLKTWALNCLDPAASPRAFEGELSVIAGNALAAQTDNALVLLDPVFEGGREIRVELPPTRQWEGALLEAWSNGESVSVVSIARDQTLNLDVFDAGDGEHVFHQNIAGRGVPRASGNDGSRAPERTGATIRQPRALVSADAAAVYVLTGMAASGLAHDAVKMVYRAAAPFDPAVAGTIAADGDDDIVMTGTGGREGALRLAHDGGSLRIEFVSRERMPERPDGGRDRAGTAERLDLTLRTNTGLHHWGLWLDEFGALQVDMPGGVPPPEARTAAEVDIMRGRVTYALQLPLGRICNRIAPDWRDMELLASAWDEILTPAETLELQRSGVSAGYRLPERGGHAIHLHPRTRAADNALRSLMHAFPDAAPSRDYLADTYRRLRPETAAARALLDDFIRRHPTTAAVDDVMALRAAEADYFGERQRRELEDRAAEAGVSAAARRRLADQWRAVLSQRIYIDPGVRRPNGIVLELNGETADTVWTRVYWGAIPAGERAAARYVGPLPSSGEWHDLRVPLAWIGLHDKPIYGIAFRAFGSTSGLIWGASRVVAADGVDYPIVAGRLPEGALRGRWHWSEAPVDEGRPGHVHQEDHAVFRMRFPISGHIADPIAERPRLVQRIRFSGRTRPDTLAIGLHDGRDWNFRAVWGAAAYREAHMGPLLHAPDWRWLCRDWPVQKGLYMGALPEGEGPHELLLPLDRAGLTDRPIEAIRFEQAGGRVVWEKTLLRTGAETKTLAGDTLPDGSDEPSAHWQWVGDGGRRGPRARLQVSDGDWVAHTARRAVDPVVPAPAFSGAASPAAEALVRYLPEVDDHEHAAAFFDSLYPVIVEGYREKPAEFAAKLAALLSAGAWPDRARGLVLAQRLRQAYEEAGVGEAFERVDALIARDAQAFDLAHEFRRRHFRAAPAFIRSWNVLGPLPGGLGDAYPPEAEGARIEHGVHVEGRLVEWRTFTAAGDYVDLTAPFGVGGNVVGYAANWVHVGAATDAVFEIGAAGACRVWVNRRSTPLRGGGNAARPRRDIAVVGLKEGWNEILVKIEAGRGPWGFYLEIARADGRGPLGELRVALEPPP